MSMTEAAAAPVEIAPISNPAGADLSSAAAEAAYADAQNRADMKKADDKAAEKPAEKPQNRRADMRETLKQAVETVDKKNAAEEARKAAEAPKEAPVDAKPEEVAKPEGEAKPETPVVKPEDRKPWHEAPSRFSVDAKASWESAPDPVKAEVHRALSELEQGYQKHRQSAEAYQELADYDRMAKQSGTTVKQAMDNYVGIEKLLMSDPFAGMERIVSNLGIRNPDGRPMTLHDFAARVLDQEPNEQLSRQNGTIQQLNQKISQLEQQVGAVKTGFESQQKSAAFARVSEFASQNPRFDELSGDIAFFIESGRAKDLSEAYSLAERLNPAPATGRDTPAPSTPLKPAGNKSVAGNAPAGHVSDKKPTPGKSEDLKVTMARIKKQGLI
jgi:hypothetical protein